MSAGPLSPEAKNQVLARQRARFLRPELTLRRQAGAAKSAANVLRNPDD